MSSTTANTVSTGRPTRDQASSAKYTPWYLAIYEFWVLWISSYWIFGCSISRYLLPQFRANVGTNHLDIGVGTGYYLRNAKIPPTTQLTLMDIEREPLEVARRRSRRPDARIVVADVLGPLDLGTRFDSVSMYYLLHCVRAPVHEKCRIFGRLRHVMTPDGVVHGVTMLGKGVREDGYIAAFYREEYLRWGFFCNRDDNAYDFEHALRQNFKVVETRVVGSFFIFRAEKGRFAD